MCSIIVVSRGVYQHLIPIRGRSRRDEYGDIGIVPGVQRSFPSWKNLEFAGDIDFIINKYILHGPLTEDL